MSDPAATFGVIAPHPPIMVSAVGGHRSSVTADSAAALQRVARALADFAPDAIVITSPHAPGAWDAIAVDTAPAYRGSFAQFGAARPQWSWPGDPQLAQSIIAELEARGIAAVERARDARLSSGELDHGVLVPMSFLDPQGRFPLVVVSYSGLPMSAYPQVGRAIAAAGARLGRRLAYVASGDLSHRLTPDAPAGYSPRAAELDRAIVSAVQDGRLSRLADVDESLIEAGGECGMRSFLALGGFAGPEPIPTRVLSYEGPWGVGYLVALVGDAALRLDDAHASQTAVTPSAGRKGGSPGHDASPIVRGAREVIEAYVRRGERIDTPVIDDPRLPARAGVFVTLHRAGALRGCIGTIVPTKATIAEEVAHNAIQAATRDPRFSPLSPEELDDLDVKVDVLHPPEACSIEDLDPTKYGVIATSGWRRGLLLPDLDGVDDVTTQVEIARRKGGILPHEPCRFERFRVDRYD